MAREMYLVGVDETELEPPKPPEPPKGFKAKWQNFWYHYKWPVVLGALAVVAVIILVAQMVNREHPDYHMILASTKNLPVPANDAFAAELEQYGRDLNGDGKVLVSIEFLYVGSDGGQLSAVNQQKFTATMFAGDTLFFGFSPDYYDYLLKNLEDSDTAFFDQLGVEVEGVSEDGRTWSWKGASFLQDESMKGAPEELIFGVRSASGSAGGKQSQQTHDECLELLRAYITKTPLEQPAA